MQLINAEYLRERELRAVDVLRGVKRVILMPDEIVVKRIVLSPPCPCQSGDWYEGPCDCCPAYSPRPYVEDWPLEPLHDDLLAILEGYNEPIAAGDAPDGFPNPPIRGFLPELEVELAAIAAAINDEAPPAYEASPSPEAPPAPEHNAIEISDDDEPAPYLQPAHPNCEPNLPDVVMPAPALPIPEPMDAEAPAADLPPQRYAFRHRRPSVMRSAFYRAAMCEFYFFYVF